MNDSFSQDQCSVVTRYIISGITVPGCDENIVTTLSMSLIRAVLKFVILIGFRQRNNTKQLSFDIIPGYFKLIIIINSKKPVIILKLSYLMLFLCLKPTIFKNQPNLFLRLKPIANYKLSI